MSNCGHVDACIQEAASLALEVIGNVLKCPKLISVGCGRLDRLWGPCIVGAQASSKLQQLLAAILRIQADLDETQVVLQLWLGYLIQLCLQLILSLHLMRQAITLKGCIAADACAEQMLHQQNVHEPL